MNYQDLQASILTVISEMSDVPSQQVSLSQDLQQLIGDSLSKIELFLYLEDLFKVRFTDEEMGETTIVRDLVDLVAKKRGIIVNNVQQNPHTNVLPQHIQSNVGGIETNFMRIDNTLQQIKQESFKRAEILNKKITYQRG